MPHQSPFRLIHLVFEASCLFFVPFGSVEPLERIDKPAVPKRGDSIFRVQVFPFRAVHHERRIMENQEMDKRKLLSVPRSAVLDGATTIPVTFVTRLLRECATTGKCILQLLGNLKQRS
jgi:hypothetical protein